jgi:hypothetical protein
MANDSGQRRLNVTLALLRAFIGVLLIGQPWIVGNGLDGYGATSVGIGVAVIAAASQMHRAQWLRWVQAALSMGVFFSPFLFREDDIMDREVYYAVMVGHTLLLSSIVSTRWFAQDAEPSRARMTASDDSRSAASKTSSVSTPSN